MKKTALLFLAALVALPVAAADKDSKSMRSFLSEVATTKNLAKYEDIKVNLDGFVFLVEPLQGQVGTYLVQFSDRSSGGYAGFGVWGARIVCVTDKQTAKAMVPHSHVQFTAFVSEIREVTMQDYPNSPVRPTRLIVANCNFD